MAIVKDIKPDKMPTKNSEAVVFYTSGDIDSLQGLYISIAGDFRCFLRIELNASEKLRLIKSLLQ